MFNKQLTAAVNEYYNWNSDRKPKAVKYVYNKNYTEAILVRFIDGYGIEMSSIMLYQNWADGHYDVTELDFVERADEELMIKAYEESGGEIVEE